MSLNLSEFQAFGVSVRIKVIRDGRNALKNTRELFTDIRHMKSPENLESEEYRQIDHVTYIKQLMEEHEVKPKDLIIRLNVERSYLYQILKGRRAPGRDFLLRFARLLQLNLEETQRLLKIAQRQPLYPRNKRDAAIIYAITHKLKLEEFDSFIESLENEYE